MGRELSSYERRQELLRWIERNGRISIAEIRAQFGVSEATARRDLIALSEERRIQRVRGGGILIRQAPPEPPLLQREQEQFAEKQRIGRAAAALVKDHETIFLASGTTTLAIAQHLRGRRNLTVITNSLPVMNVLAKEPGITLIGIGGMLRPSELSFIGHIAEQAIGELRADKVFIGVRALSIEHGLTGDYLLEVLTDRAILKIGREVIVVADHTKFGAVASAFIAPVTSVHRIITDTAAPPAMVAALRRLGIEVLLV